MNDGRAPAAERLVRQREALDIRMLRQHCRNNACLDSTTSRSLAYRSCVIAWADIQRYCDTIAREFRPHRIVLFGSYAYGAPVMLTRRPLPRRTRPPCGGRPD